VEALLPLFPTSATSFYPKVSPFPDFRALSHIHSRVQSLELRDRGRRYLRIDGSKLFNISPTLRDICLDRSVFRYRDFMLWRSSPLYRYSRLTLERLHLRDAWIEGCDRNGSWRS
jgi:hypothetical protein